jgi:hypothetical protein
VELHATAARFCDQDPPERVYLCLVAAGNVRYLYSPVGYVNGAFPAANSNEMALGSVLLATIFRNVASIAQLRWLEESRRMRPKRASNTVC